MVRLPTFALALPLALAACTSGPDYAPPPAPASQALASGAFLRGGEKDTAAVPSRWWEGLDDPQLAALIDKGLKDAPAVAAAEARMRQARAGLSASRAALRPVLGSSATYIHAGLPDNSLGQGASSIDLFSLSFDAQWEADLWGGKRRAAEASRAQADAAAARLADARVALSAEIARSYVTLRAREESAALLKQRHALETRLAEIARLRHEGGTATRQGLEAALLQAGQTEGEQAAIAAEIAALRDGLAVLTGEAPGALDAMAPAAIPLPPAQVATGNPAAMLARRPDIRAAERQLAAANARIGVEAARRFPELSLTGLIGIGGNNPGDMFDTSQLTTLALPRLTWSFLDFGRTKAAVEGAEAARDAALADYRGAVLSGLLDAESALARFGAARIVLARSGQAAGHAAEVARLQQLRAQAGTTAPSEALAAQRSAIDAQLAAANNRAALTLSYIALAKSLGLGWQDGD